MHLLQFLEVFPIVQILQVGNNAFLGVSLLVVIVQELVKVDQVI